MNHPAHPPQTALSPQLAEEPAFEVIRRNGRVVHFDSAKIAVALAKAFIAVQGEAGAASDHARDLIARLTESVVQVFRRRLPAGGTLHIEDIQDQVELVLMRAGAHDVARAYVLYREKRAAERKAQAAAEPEAAASGLHVLRGGQRLPLERKELLRICRDACTGLAAADADLVVEQAMKNLYDEVPWEAVLQSLVLAARTLIEKDPDYSRMAARLLLHCLRAEVRGAECDFAAMCNDYADALACLVREGVTAGLLDARLAEFDLARLGAAIDADNDLRFGYLGLQTLYDRYFLHVDGRRIELPQTFFMRVAMGLAINEIDREARAIEFYKLIAAFDFMSSTPTLFNSGTRHSQLSSCYLTTVSDDLADIFGAVRENALLQKFAGGLGNDWTPVRALGARIKGTNGESQGVIPFLKVVNDTAVAVNQGGKRKGAVCAYLETWHLDIEDFLDLRKNTGDERRRTHDMNTAHWIPDLFMQRVAANAEWTLFSPHDVPDLHDLYGADFAAAYSAYEAKAEQGEIKLSKRIPAVQLWRRMLGMLFETGHPWITFKDPCNLRSPQQHVGVVHSSNLCTEITLNTSDTETAVCNLGSVNLLAHLKNGELDLEKLKRTVTTALRMLDNVIDINYYASNKARISNLRHRPVGMGVMGFSDCLQTLGLAYASPEAVDFADRSMEAVCYYAYAASSKLAQERGSYSSYTGSLWSKGILPQDSIALVEAARGEKIPLAREERLDWASLRAQIAQHGMRNSNCVAIAPTATISNIVGVSASIEPEYQNLYVKSNLSGEFVMVNEHLVRELKQRDLWDDVMIADLKYFDGSLAPIGRIPDELKARYATAFEIDASWLIEAGARRQQWIDQAQSLNLYVAGASGRKLDEIYTQAWRLGLKTTYYLRTLGATAMEKTSLPTAGMELPVVTENDAPKFCSILDPECEACQ